MKYDFNKISQRRNTNSIKWDVKENELPMWVADMDFLALPEIKDALLKAVDQQCYGYSYPTEPFFKAYQSWWLNRHNLKIDTKNMIYVSGVVSALDSLINHLTNVGDAVLLLSPSYNGFFSVVNNNKRTLVTSDLIYENNEFIINYDDVERKIIANNVKATIFCNPHNPVGKIWSKEEISKFYLICKKHNVMMISDEIHCDLVEPNYHYVPALTIADDIITCLAPSKVFNLAGLQSAITVINNQEIRNLMQEAFYHDDIGEPNFFVEPATIAAFKYGGQYVDELNEYIYKNKCYVIDFFKKELPTLKAVSGQATYLLWIDISYYQIPSDEFARRLRKETGLYVNDGLHYGNGKNYLRMNIATSLDNVKDALNRFKSFLAKNN